MERNRQIYYSRLALRVYDEVIDPFPSLRNSELPVDMIAKAAVKAWRRNNWHLIDDDTQVHVIVALESGLNHMRNFGRTT